MTGPASENAVFDALKADGAELRRSLHLDFQKKVDFLISSYLVPLHDVEGAPVAGTRRRRVLDVPFAVQFTIDWNNTQKMQEYCDLVRKEREEHCAGERRRIYVQVERSATGDPVAVAAGIIEWIERLQAVPSRKYEGIEILREGTSYFSVRSRIKQKQRALRERREKEYLSRDKEEDLAMLTRRAIAQDVSRSGTVVDVRYRPVDVRVSGRAADMFDEDAFVTKYQVGGLDVRDELTGEVLHFRRGQFADRRLRNIVRDVVDVVERRDPIVGSYVSFDRVEDDEPHDLMLLVG